MDENGLGARLGPLVVTAVLSEVTRTQRLSRARRGGQRRSSIELHAMARLFVELRREAARELAVCGKVGAMSDCGRSLEPLSRFSTSELAVTPERSCCFRGFGVVHSVRDADARGPFLMLAPLVGEYVGEIPMPRVTRFHRATDDAAVSGYPDARQLAWGAATRLQRRSRVTGDCFERETAA